MKIILLVGLRGDMDLAERQLEFQGVTMETGGYDLYIIGDVWGAANVVCTAQKAHEDHHEYKLLKWLLEREMAHKAGMSFGSSSRSSKSSKSSKSPKARSSKQAKSSNSSNSSNSSKQARSSNQGRSAKQAKSKSSEVKSSETGAGATIIVPGRIDRALIKSCDMNMHLLGGDESQKRRFRDTLLNKKNFELLRSMCRRELTHPLHVRIAENTSAVRSLCRYIDKSMWPTCYEVEGRYIEPMSASCFTGCDGMELHGLIGDGVHVALSSTKEAAVSGMDASEAFTQTFTTNMEDKLDKHRQEVRRLKALSVCFKDGAFVNVVMLPSQADRHLDWSSFKSVIVARYRKELHRALISEDILLALMDKVMINASEDSDS